MRLFTKGKYQAWMLCAFVCLNLLLMAGCQTQKGRVISADDPGRVGSHQAGSEVFRPVVCSATNELLVRAAEKSYENPAFDGNQGMVPNKKRVCFFGVTNKTNEDLGDFKDQITEVIDSTLAESDAVNTVTSKAVVPVLRKTGMSADDLFLPKNMSRLCAEMENDQPFDCLIFATLTSGTTVDNRDSQKDYTLSLEMVDVRNPGADRIKVAKTVRKEYNKTAKAKARGWFLK